MNDKPKKKREAIRIRLSKAGQKPKKKKISIDDSTPTKTKRTFYLADYSNDKLNLIYAKMIVRREKSSISSLIEKSIDLLYEIEMSEPVKN